MDVFADVNQMPGGIGQGVEIEQFGFGRIDISHAIAFPTKPLDIFKRVRFLSLSLQSLSELGENGFAFSENHIIDQG